MSTEIRHLGLMVKTFLVISPEPWDGHTVSKHHYAVTLAVSGYRVLFLGPPTNGSHLVVNASQSHPNLFVVHAPRVKRGLRFYPGFMRRRMERSWLQQLESVVGVAIDVVWLFENSRFFDMRFAGSRLKIYHQVDVNQNLHPATAARTADICFCTSDGIRERLLPYNPLVYKIHHGTAVPAQPLGLSATQTASMQQAAHNACYIGNLDMVYLDAELLAKVVKTLPAVRFHFIGGFSSQGHLHRITSQLPNVEWWGKVPSAQIPSILARADIVLCTYKAALFREQLASPHKFMEYLASGKTIVATYTDEYKDKRHLLEMVDNVSDYVATFGRVLVNLAEYNSPERQAQRVAFAMDHSYPKQFAEIVSILKKHDLAVPFAKST